MKIPNIDFWSYDEFIQARRRQFEASKENPPIWKKGFEIIHLDPGDKINCDSCNAEIIKSNELINLVEFGKRVVCDICYQKNYAHLEIQYKEV